MTRSKTGMPPDPFPRARVAREALREMAKEILDMYMENARNAKDDREYEVAMKSLQWLMEHMPADSDGVKVLDASVDKQPKQVEKGSSGPRISIGVAIGGISQPKELGPKVEVLEVKDGESS